MTGYKILSVMHTSASLALNESWDPDVRDDMEMMLNKIVPEGLPYRHSCEGPDDMVNIRYLKFKSLNTIRMIFIDIHLFVLQQFDTVYCLFCLTVTILVT